MSKITPNLEFDDVARTVAASNKFVRQALSLPVPVKLRSQSGKGTLVSWVENGKEKRGWIPNALFGEEVAASDLARAVPYGVPWAQLIPARTIDPEAIETALHNAGIWTKDDLSQHPQAALGAIQSAYKLDLAALLTAAAGYQTKEA